jgi:iron complex outermembrane receptor protein
LVGSGFATLNLSSTFNQNNVSGFETSTNGYTLVNLGFGGKVTVGKTIFNVNLNGITCSIKDTLLIFPT